MFERFWFERYTPIPGDVIVDIGAGKGEDIAAFCERVRPGGRVVAVEAHPEVFKECLAICSSLGVECENAACVGTPGEVQIETCSNYESGYTFRGTPTATSHTVQGKTLAQLLNGFVVGRIDLLKMNIEGAEREALYGSVEVLEQVRHAVIACHDFKSNRGESPAFRTVEPVCELLRSCGFEFWVKPDWYHVHAWRKNA